LVRRCTKTSMRVSERLSCQAMMEPPEPSAITVGPLCPSAESHTTAPSACHCACATEAPAREQRTTRTAIPCPRTRNMIGLPDVLEDAELYKFIVSGPSGARARATDRELRSCELHGSDLLAHQENRDRFRPFAPRRRDSTSRAARRRKRDHRAAR